MTLKEAVEIAQRKYTLEKYSKYTYYINTNLMYNPCNFVTITIKDIYNKAYITDVGDTLQYTSKFEDEIKSICVKN